MTNANALVATLLATALVAGSDEDVVQRLHVRFAPYDIAAKSCREAVGLEAEPGTMSVRYTYRITGTRWLAPHRRTGTIVFALGDVTIRLPGTIVWPDMTDADRERAAALRHAIEHHEIGHVRIAEAVRDALNADEPLVAPDLATFEAAAKARGRAGFERFEREERAYDELTDHGQKQHEAPGALNGPDSVLRCTRTAPAPAR